MVEIERGSVESLRGCLIYIFEASLYIRSLTGGSALQQGRNLFFKNIAIPLFAFLPAFASILFHIPRKYLYGIINKSNIIKKNRHYTKINTKYYYLLRSV